MTRSVGSLWGSSAALLAARVAQEQGAAVLALLASDDAAEDFAEDAATLSGLPAEALDWESRSTRVAQAAGLADPGPRVFAVSLNAALKPWPDRVVSIALRRGDALSYGDLLSRLEPFERVALVEAPGQYAVRGGLVDLFPLGDAQPLRVEYFGDSIESIRRFDVDTQGSLETLDRALAPLSFEDGSSLLERFKGIVLAVDLTEPPHGAWRLTTLPAPEGENPRVESLQRFSGTLANVAKELAELAERYRVAVYSVTPGEEDRLREILREGGVDPDRFAFARGRLHHGFAWDGVAHVPNSEVFHRQALRRRAAARAPKEWDAFLEIEPLDFVVHANHGIGRFKGFVTLDRDGGPQEFAAVEFADRTLVYVPGTDLDLLQRYHGGTDRPPSLSHVGTGAWDEAKERAQESARALAQDLLRTQAAREALGGTAYPPDGEWQREFDAEFPYEETPDQLEAASAVKRDLEAPRPMDRLMCGDVGYGKTEIAMRAAFKVATGGKQVAVLVPTTVLAEQHLRTFRERMADYPVTIAALSRFQGDKQQQETLARLKRGEVDIVIGTHRLVQPDVAFRDLGLVIIDEEQRFGVEHKEALKRLRASVEVLTMTATPIPRTLHMALLGIRDITSLTTPPADRRSIRTYVVAYDDEVVTEAIRHELARGGQVYYVFNRVESIEQVAARIQRLVPEASVGIAHGQMEEGELAAAMAEFLDRQIDVLVCTTIIESGLDIPTVNTIFVQEADWFGLADLHQLRGRVGRYKHQAYAYFLMPHDRIMTPQGYRRLKAIEEFSELGAGFKIAMRDLEIRGAGNLLGREQHGHIAAVGYEMYCGLLAREVGRMRGEDAPPERPEPRIELAGAAGVPATYIPDAKVRMEVYRKIARAPDLEAVRRHIADRFGRIPPELDGLIRRVRLKRRAQELGIVAIEQGQEHIEFRFVDARAAKAVKGLRMADALTAGLPYRGENPLELVEKLLGIA